MITLGEFVVGGGTAFSIGAFAVAFGLEFAVDLSVGVLMAAATAIVVLEEVEHRHEKKPEEDP